MKVLGLIVSMVVFSQAAFAQVWSGGPRVFSYQGVIEDQNGKPISDGDHTVQVELWGGSSGISLIYTEQQKVTFHKGVFDLVVGSDFGGTASDPAGELPEFIDFSSRLWIQLTIDPGGAGEYKFPRSPILSSPYALNSERVNGIEASATPQSGKLFPLPLVNGKIDPAILPKPDTTYVESINAIGGPISLVSGGGIAVANDVIHRTITISQLTPPPGTSATLTAVGTTAQRPASPQQGMIRFNTTTSKFEGYDGTNWVNLN